MRVQVPGGPLTAGGVEATLRPRPLMRGGRRGRRSEPQEAQEPRAHKSSFPSQLCSPQGNYAGSASPKQQLPRPAPTGDAVIGCHLPGPAPTALPCCPYLRAAVRAPEGQSRRGRRVILVLPDPGRCARVSRPAAPFQLPVSPGFSWSPPVGQGHGGNGGSEDRGADTWEPSSFRWEN